MRIVERPLLIFSIFTILLVLSLTVATIAGPEKVTFPPNYKSQVLYTTVDRPDTKQVRDIYAPPDAVKAAKAGQPFPSGTIIAMEVYRAKVNDKGEPLKDDKGRFIKGDLFGIFVMEKRTGWGAEYPENLRNGEWEYSRFTPDGKPHQPPDTKPCLECHKPYGGQDFVLTFPELAAAPASR